MQLENRFHIIQIALLVLGLFFSFFYAQHQMLTGDQIQMLYKGYMGAYTGEWISYGNAASVVGNVPGTMISYVVGLPVMVYDSPWSPMVFLIFFHLLSYFLLDNVIKDIFKTDIRLVFLVIYWLNPWFLFENILYNPSYLFFFSALHIWSAYKQREKSSFVYSALHVIAIGLALQFHYSWLILSIISLYLVYRKMVKVNWYGVVFGGTIIIISLIPYAIEYLDNKEIRENQNAKGSGRYIGWGGVHVYPVLKAFLYWLRYDSFIFPNKLINSAHFDWLGLSATMQTVVVYLYKAIVFSVGAVSIYIAFKANQLFYRTMKSKVFKRSLAVTSKEEWLLLYVFGALFGVFISAILSPIIFGYWHLIIVFPFALMPFLIYFKSYSEKYLNKFLVFIVLYFVMVNSIGAIDSRKFSLEKDYAQDVREYVAKTIQIPE
ncbi:MAG: 3-deoxy-D-manno-octulosonic acid transferase [Sulfurimonas sp.]